MTVVSQDLMSAALGVAVAVGDAASPDPFYTVTKSGGTIVRDATPGTTHIPRWAKFVLTSTAQCNWVLTNTAGKQHGVANNFYFPSLPSADVELLAIHTAGPTYYLNLFLTSAGKLKLMYSSNVIWTSTGSVSTNTEYFIYASLDATTTTGSYVVKTYSAGGALISGLSFTGTYGTIGTGSPAYYSSGVSHTGAVSSYTYYIGRPIGRNDLTEISQYSAGSSSNAGPDISNIEPFSTVALDGSLAAGTTFGWSYSATNGAAVTINNNSSKVASYVAPANLAGTDITFTLTVDGAATDSAIHHVLPHSLWVKSGALWVPGRFL